MKTILLSLAMVAGLGAATSAVAQSDHSDKQAAKQQCSSERGKSKATREAFRARYGSRSRCVRQKTAEEHDENKAAHDNAAKQCKAERADPNFAATHEGKTFEEFYGTNENLNNAYGKCVSGKAKAQKDEMDAKDAREAKKVKNAAKRCAAERHEIGTTAFAAKYGTNRNDRNAFGKCVSGKAVKPPS